MSSISNSDLVPIIQGVIEIFSIAAELKNIRLRVEIPDTLEVYADCDMMKTVIRNLISKRDEIHARRGRHHDSRPAG